MTESIKYSVDFQGPGHLKGTWHGCGEYNDRGEAVSKYEKLIASDLEEGARPGCRWRVSGSKGAEIVEVIRDQTLTAGGLTDTKN